MTSNSSNSDIKENLYISSELTIEEISSKPLGLTTSDSSGSGYCNSDCSSGSWGRSPTTGYRYNEEDDDNYSSCESGSYSDSTSSGSGSSSESIDEKSEKISTENDDHEVQYKLLKLLKDLGINSQSEYEEFLKQNNI